MAHAMKGIITLWSGAVVDIPFGWKLCDGANGTPDLRNQFVVGAGSTYSPGQSGGSTSHQHATDSGSHSHDLVDGAQIQAGSDYYHATASSLVTGTTDFRTHLPPYYALCYIMHI